MKKIKNFLLLIVLVIFAVGNIFYLVEVSAYGAEVSELEKESAAVSKQIQSYKEQIMSKSSLVAIENKADQLGFVKPQNMIYLAGENVTVAELP
jgi:uncharacterized protein (UPF0333 family)